MQTVQSQNGKNTILNHVFRNRKTTFKKQPKAFLLHSFKSWFTWMTTTSLDWGQRLWGTPKIDLKCKQCYFRFKQKETFRTHKTYEQRLKLITQLKVTWKPASISIVAILEGDNISHFQANFHWSIKLTLLFTFAAVFQLNKPKISTDIDQYFHFHLSEIKDSIHFRQNLKAVRTNPYLALYYIFPPVLGWIKLWNLKFRGEYILWICSSDSAPCGVASLVTNTWEGDGMGVLSKLWIRTLLLTPVRLLPCLSSPMFASWTAPANTISRININESDHAQSSQNFNYMILLYELKDLIQF